MDCPLDSHGKVMCTANLYMGRCASPAKPKPFKWCYYSLEDRDVCCASSSSACCSEPFAPFAFVFALTIISLVLLCCCFAGVFRRWNCIRRRCRNFLSCCFGRRIPDSPSVLPVNWNYSPGPPRNRHSHFIFPELDPVIDPKFQKECIVCFARKRETVLPCGHCVLCVECTQHLLRVNPSCPQCRQHFEDFSQAEGQPTFRNLVDLLHRERPTGYPSAPETMQPPKPIPAIELPHSTSTALPESTPETHPAEDTVSTSESSNSPSAEPRTVAGSEPTV